MNIGALLPRHARYRPDHLALVVGDQRLTYRKLNAVVNRLANALLTNGIAKGEKIATILPNCLELMIAYWAAAKTGIVIVPMSTLLQDHGLATLLRDSDFGRCTRRGVLRRNPRPDSRRSAGATSWRLGAGGLSRGGAAGLPHL